MTGVTRLRGSAVPHASTQILNSLYKRYQKSTLLIITDKPQELVKTIREATGTMRLFSKAKVAIPAWKGTCSTQILRKKADFYEAHSSAKNMAYGGKITADVCIHRRQASKQGMLKILIEIF